MDEPLSFRAAGSFGGDLRSGMKRGADDQGQGGGRGWKAGKKGNGGRGGGYFNNGNGNKQGRGGGWKT